MRKQEQLNFELPQHNNSGSTTNRQALFQQHLHLNQEQGLMGSAIANVMVIVGFAAFAYSVTYVLKSLSQ